MPIMLCSACFGGNVEYVLLLGAELRVSRLQFSSIFCPARAETFSCTLERAVEPDIFLDIY